MGKQWQRERKKEHFYKMAKNKGYRSRASFKLQQLNNKYDLLRKGNVVVDLGAAPGGWLQIALEKVGEKGFVLGVDLEPIKNFSKPNLATIQADIIEPETVATIRELLPRKADVVLSDASPDISGIWNIDQAKSVDLAQCVLIIASQILKQDGKMLIKVFQGAMFDELLTDIRKNFGFVKVSKPEASRKRSAEVYIIAKEFRGATQELEKASINNS